MRTTVDGNEAAASVAYRLSEVCCIYPITPSSPMAELADEWSSKGQPNVWGSVPSVVEMQSEGGAAGALHGALQGGALATTFTASQGLLLMIPNMYKIAGELTPAVLHVAARSLAAQGLSIFGDHSDVMAVRQTGFALLASASVQEAHDLALVAHAATLRTRVPFVHFFDGFRTSHELNTIELLADDDLRALVPEELVRAHRGRALSPGATRSSGAPRRTRTSTSRRGRRSTRSTRAVPGVGAGRDGRAWPSGPGAATGIVEYTGHPRGRAGDRGDGLGRARPSRETVAYLCAQGERVGVAQVRLYRPFPAQALARGAADVRGADRGAGPDQGARLGRASRCSSTWSPRWPSLMPTVNGRLCPLIIGGRYGLSSKEFTPAMVAGVFAELARERPRRAVHDRHHRRRVRDQPAVRPVAGHRAARTRSARCSSASARTARSARTRTRSRSSARRRTCTPRATSSTTRRSRARRPCRTCASGRSRSARRTWWPGRASSAATSSGCWSGSTCSAAPHRARRCCSTARIRPSEVWDALPRPVQEQILAKGIDVYAIDAGADRPRGRAGRADQHGAADLLLRDLRRAAAATRRSTGSRRRSPRPTAGAAPRWCERNQAAVDRALEGLHRIEVPEQVTADPGAARRWSRPGAGVRPHRHRGDDGRPRRRPAGQRAAGRTAPTRAAPRPTRNATSPNWSPCGTPSCASSAATAASSARTA